jgi:hypothetical protein
MSSMLAQDGALPVRSTLALNGIINQTQLFPLQLSFCVKF